MYYAAVLIFQSLNTAERRDVCHFMLDNRELTLGDAVLALFDVYIVNGEDTVVRREPPLPLLRFPMHTLLPDDETVPF